FFIATATARFYTLSLHDALPICCKHDLEQYCSNGFTGTYNSPDHHLGGRTFGGYAEKIVVDENFVLNVPSNLNLAAVAPLLCAGDRKSTRLNSSHVKISYAVFCL